MNYNLNDNGGFLSPRSIAESYNMTVAKENDELKKQLKAYENMRKEANKWVEDNVYLDYYGMPVIPNNSKVNELIDILNKVGEDNE